MTRGFSRRLIVATLLIASLGALPVRAATPPEELRLRVGQNHVLTLETVATRVAVGDPAVADVKALRPTELLVLGVAEGRTTVQLWHGAGVRREILVSVRRASTDAAQTELESLLTGIPGVRVRLVGERLFVDGETRTAEDAARVATVLAAFPEVKSLVRAAAVSVDDAQVAQLQKELTARGLKSVQVRRRDGGLRLEGTVDSAESQAEAVRIASAPGTPVESLLRIQPPMVRVDVELVELRGGTQRAVGIQWPDRIATTAMDASASVSHGNLTGTESLMGGSVGIAASAALQMRLNSGTAHLLSQPRLLCGSGEKARLTVGGELPVPAISANSASVEWKPFGVIVEVVPVVEPDGRINTAVTAELSDVDASLTVRSGGSAMPGLRKREVHTKVSLRPGEPVLLSGLFHDERQKVVEKVPLLGEIPLLGELFKSREIVERRSELLVIVTPRLAQPDEPAEAALVEQARRRYREASEAPAVSLGD